jgi:hypothetical protein
VRLLKWLISKIRRDARDRELADAYRRGYAEHPPEEWLGKAGLAGLAAFDRAEGRDPL